MKVRELIERLQQLDPDATAYIEADDFSRSISADRVLLKIDVVEGRGAGCNMDVLLVPEIPVRAAQPVHVPR